MNHRLGYALAPNDGIWAATALFYSVVFCVFRLKFVIVYTVCCCLKVFMNLQLFGAVYEPYETYDCADGRK
jgi:hypothetical protein